MKEPSVTLTDYLLAIECALFAWLLSGGEPTNSFLQSYFISLFIALALAAFLGGTVHGFFPMENNPAHRILWPATLLAVGVAAFCAWGIGAHVLFSPQIAGWVTVAAGCLLAIYVVVALFIYRDFAIAIIHYLPAVLFALSAFAILAVREMHWAPALCFLGLVGTVIAAAIQARRIGIHPVYFDHNALYHLLQGAALMLFFFGARSIIAV